MDGYLADTPADVRPIAVRALRILLWSETALTAVMVLAGAVAAGPSLWVLVQLAVFACPGAVACAAAVRFTRPRTGHYRCLVAAAVWQLVIAVAELVTGDPRGLTSSLLPAAIVILLRAPTVRAHYPHRSRTRPPDEAGSAILEYLALGVLAALIIGGLTTLGLPSTIGTATKTVLCSVLGEKPCPSATARRNTPATAPYQGTNTTKPANRGTPPNGNDNDTPSAATPPGTPGATPVACHGLLSCAWHALTADPHEAARRMPCTNVLTCAGHGFLELWSSQWNVDRAFVGDLKGMADLFHDPGALGAAAGYAVHHPLEAARQLVWDDESVKMWQHGNPIGAVSRGIWNVGSWLIPGGQAVKGLSESAKLAKLARLADKAGELGRLARAARDAGKAAYRAKRLAGKGDLEGARKAATDARRDADDAEKEARKKGCKIAPAALPALPGEGEDECGAAAAADRKADEADKHANTPVSPQEAERMVRVGKRVGSALKSDAYHRGASYAIGQISRSGRVFVVTGDDGARYTLVQVLGGMNGKTGRFEWLVDSQGRVTHQMFVPGGNINGKI